MNSLTIDWVVLEKMIELDVSAADILSMWKAHEKKRAAVDNAENPRDRLFSEGLLKLINMTGRTPPSCRSFIGKCLKAAGDDPIVVLQAIDDAVERRVADAIGWIAGRLKHRNQSTVVHPADINWDQVCSSYKRFAVWSRWAGPDPTSPACRCPRELLVKHGIVAHEPA